MHVAIPEFGNPGHEQVTANKIRQLVLPHILLLQYAYEFGISVTCNKCSYQVFIACNKCTTTKKESGLPVCVSIIEFNEEIGVCPKCSDTFNKNILQWLNEIIVNKIADEWND